MLVHVAELNPVLNASGVAQVLRYCSHPSASRTDGVDWKPLLVQPFRRNIQQFDGSFKSQVPEVGNLEFALSKGDDPAALTSMGWDGRRVRIWRGTAGQTTAAMTLVFDGVSRDVSGDRKRVRVTLRGNDYKLDQPLLSSSYAGTGLAEGPAELKGRLKPFMLGTCLNVEPVYINRALGIFQWHGYGPAGAAMDCTAVYDSGSLLGTSVGDYASYAALAAATIPAGRYATCLALGMGRHGGDVSGVLTIDAAGMREATTVTPGLAIYSLLYRMAGLAPTSQFKDSSTVWLDGQVPYPVDLYVTNQVTILEQCQQIMLTLGGYLTYTDAGLVTVGLIRRGGASSVSLDRLNIGALGVQTTSPPVWKRRMGYQRSWRTHSYSEVRTPREINPRGPWSASPAPLYQYYDLADYANARWLYINTLAGNTAAPGTDANVWLQFDTQGAAVVESTSAPPNPVSGMLWRNPTTGALNVYISGAWVLTADVTSLNTAAQITGQGFLATANTADFATRVTGAEKPADNATNDLLLFNVGSQAVTIRGNTFVRNAGSVDYNACVRSDVYRDAIFAEVDTVPVGYTVISLDDQVNNADLASMNFTLRYQSSTGNYEVYSSGTLASSGNAGAVSGKLVLTYDGIRYRAYGPAGKFGSDVLLLGLVNSFAKWHDYNGSGVSGLRAGIFGANYWADVGGVGRPETYATNSQNMIPNSGAEDNVIAPWVPVNVTGSSTLTVSSAQFTSGAKSFLLTKPATGDTIIQVSAARPVVPGTTYVVRVRLKAGVASGSGTYVRVWAKATELPNISENNGENYTGNNYSLGYENIATSTAWTLYEALWTCPSGLYWASLTVQNYINGPTSLNVDEAFMAPQVDFALAVGGATKPENNATVTSWIDGPKDIFIPSPSDVLAPAGLPWLQPYTFRTLAGAVAGTSVTWTAAVVGSALLTVSINASGVLSIDATGGIMTSGLVRITGVYLGRTASIDIPVTRNTLGAPYKPYNLGGSSLGSANVDSLGFNRTLLSANSTTFHNVMSGRVLTVTCGPLGIIDFEVELQYRAVDISATRTLEFKFQDYDSGTTSATFTADVTPTADNPGRLLKQYQRTGITANTTRQVYGAFRITTNSDFTATGSIRGRGS